MLESRAIRRPSVFPSNRSGWHQRGFTAIELMVTIAIVAVLAALAAPSFTSLAERWRVRQAAEELQSTLYFARSEAIKRGGGVSIVAESNDWANGWKVSHTQNGVTADLQVTTAPTRLAVAHSTSKTTLWIDRWGMLSDTSGGVGTEMNFLISPEGKTPTDGNSTRLCATAGGRISQEKQSGNCQ